MIAMIPARAGSKGVPNKNLRIVAGKPLIWHTIDTALKSGSFESVVVSTDSEEIARLSESYGADVPFLRPRELASDDAKSVDVVLHALKELEARGRWNTANICLLQPTCPLRTTDDIAEAIRLFHREGSQGSVISVCKVGDPHPYKMKVVYNGRLYPLFPGMSSEVARQSMPEVYRLNGALYICASEALNKQRSFFHATHNVPFIMPENRSVNIDSELDIALVEILMKESGS